VYRGDVQAQSKGPPLWFRLPGAKVSRD
jgi:hypothetical protein